MSVLRNLEDMVITVSSSLTRSVRNARAHTTAEDTMARLENLQWVAALLGDDYLKSFGDFENTENEFTIETCKFQLTFELVQL